MVEGSGDTSRQHRRRFPDRQAAELFPQVMLVVVVGQHLAQADDVHGREHGPGDRNRVGVHPQVGGIEGAQLCFGGLYVPEDRTASFPDQCGGDVRVPPGIENLPDVADRETCIAQPGDERCLRYLVGGENRYPVAGSVAAGMRTRWVP
nr:hypothetical protein [Corynebacterium meridianum]